MTETSELEREKTVVADAGAAGGGLRVLIVDDDYTNRLILRAMLIKEEYRVSMAENGAEAVELFQRERPDMVLMDVMMPIMDGYDATRRIKELAGDHFVPVIFLTAVNDERALAKCIEYGGDDFLTKPYNRVILKAKIEALTRVRKLYLELQEQHDALEVHNQRLQREQEIAEIVFSNIVEPGCLDAPNLKYLLSPMAVTNGDLVMAARKPSGGQHVMLGDLTGHGLSAAIGAMPVSDLFYRMTDKGYSILDLVVELNQRLKDRLPVGLFLAATLIELDASHSTLTVWNGGLPDVLVVRDGRVIHRIPSSHLPLGVIDSEQLESRVEILEVEEGDRIYVYSDGVIEAVNPGGDMFGQERLEAFFGGETERAAGMFEEISEGLERFRDGAPQADDITLIEVTCDAELLASSYDRHALHLPGRAPMTWNMQVEFQADTLRTVDPLPQLVQVLTELQGLEEHRTRIYTVLAELFSNALEHGVLRLDSELKESPHGFAEYYGKRQQALEELTDGWVRVSFEHRPVESGGELVIRIEDSGPGFDFTGINRDLADNVERQGRGIALVRTLCNEVLYSGNGSCVQARYGW